MMTTDRKLIRDIAAFLCDASEMEGPLFMEDVAKEMEKRGYKLECRQQSFHTAQLWVVRC